MTERVRESLRRLSPIARPELCSRGERSPKRDPSRRSLTRPPLIRRGHGGEREWGYGHHGPAIRSLASEPPARQGSHREDTKRAKATVRLTEVRNGRKRRGRCPLRVMTLRVQNRSTSPPCGSAGCAGNPSASYHSSRRGTLTLTQKAAICSRAGNQTLRELAAEVGVSHETVRAILRTAGAADVGDGLAVERGRPSP
jgi:hypothetical protein